jgi:hypothetical protein
MELSPKSAVGRRAGRLSRSFEGPAVAKPDVRHLRLGTNVAGRVAASAAFYPLA